MFDSICKISIYMIELLKSKIVGSLWKIFLEMLSLWWLCLRMWEKKRPDIFKPFWMAVMLCRVYHTRSIFASRSDENHLFISSSDPTLVVSFQHLLFFDWCLFKKKECLHYLSYTISAKSEMSPTILNKRMSHSVLCTKRLGNRCDIIVGINMTS